eukprot:CAMPEP_0178914638 /NCGR_PEP_ID=MMETSP0786-20121207/11545_1 /TAXON_ID=186022 /ORGANISM="Thalassionema frauenfeldii, Strain CCMP 1798" /LENGTH=586 /DNA_ID=CAMNT_0020587585 /DNA_START=198 /DNA_END=1958 /DNA_ORIENTATION=-
MSPTEISKTASSLDNDNSLFVYSSDDSVCHSDAYFSRTTSAGASSLTYSPEPSETKSQHEGAAESTPFLHTFTKSTLEDYPHLQLPFSANRHDTSYNVQLQKKIKLQQFKSHYHYSYHSTNESSHKLHRKPNKEQEARENLVLNVRGKVQPEGEWKDTVWLIIFLFQFFVVVLYAIRSGIFSVFSTYNDDDDLSSSEQNDQDIIIATTADSNASFHIDYQTVVELIIILGFYATILSILTMGFMLILARSLLQTALILTTVTAFGWGLIGLAMEPFYIIPMMGFGALLVTLAYSLWVWDRIPFAGINLYTALCGVRSTLFILLVGMLMSLVAFGWFIFWSMALIGVVDNFGYCIHDYYAIFFYAFMIISLCWTHLVIKNIVQVTVSSAVGTWWFEGDCDGKVVSRSLGRSFTKLLGSICLGSLVLIPLQILRFVTCLDFLKSYNVWAFTYVGIYGYPFVEAGERARQLFQAREWEKVVNDNLIHIVFLMVSIGIGGCTGTFGVLLEEVDGYEFTSFHKPIITAFLIGCALGFIVSSTLLFGVLNSSANTLLICFAADPFTFHKNHPELSQDLRRAWSQQVWEPTTA